MLKHTHIPTEPETAIPQQGRLLQHLVAFCLASNIVIETFEHWKDAISANVGGCNPLASLYSDDDEWPGNVEDHIVLQPHALGQAVGLFFEKRASAN